MSALPDDTVVYFLMHTEVGEDGRTKAKTLGKIIDNHYTLEGLFPIVLMAGMSKSRHWFETVNDGSSTVRRRRICSRASRWTTTSKSSMRRFATIGSSNR